MQAPYHPKISIVMPTYNRAHLIGETIQSIIDQEFQDWELIIIDDASSDGTKELVEAIPDPRIRYMLFPKIGYGIKLRATGIGYADGEWIAFADSDDQWARDKLLKQSNALEQFPDAMFCLTGGFNFRQKDQPLEYFYPGKKGHRFGELLLPIFRSEVALFPQTLLFRRTCIPLVEEYAAKDPGADIQFLVGMAAEFKGIVLYDNLLYRRLHESNFSSREWEHGYKEGLQMIRYFQKNGKLSVKDARQFLFRIHIHYGEKCRVKRKRLQSFSQFMKAWRNKPFSIVPPKKIGKLVLQSLRSK